MKTSLAVSGIISLMGVSDCTEGLVPLFVAAASGLSVIFVSLVCFLEAFLFFTVMISVSPSDEETALDEVSVVSSTAAVGIIFEEIASPQPVIEAAITAERIIENKYVFFIGSLPFVFVGFCSCD